MSSKGSAGFPLLPLVNIIFTKPSGGWLWGADNQFWQYEYDQKGDVVEKREYFEGILQSTVIYEYNGEELWRVYCEDPEGNHIYDCRVEGGRIIEKVVYSTDSVTGCSYRYEYDDNGNLIMEYLLIDGEVLPGTSYSYRVVEVDYERAGFLKKQQTYLVSIT